MELNLEKLNKEQKQAVTHGSGPVLIVAGAGTGKTSVITQRFNYLVQEKQIKPEQILAITFTDKAAEEMEERIDKLLPYGYVDLWVMTFHSFCKRVLQEHGLDIGLSDFKLIDQTAAWMLIKQNIDKFNLDYYKPLGNPNKFIHALINHFSRCKDQGIYPDQYLKHAQEDKEKEVAFAFKTYQELLLENGLLDFGDLINYCLNLFNKRPEILKQYQEKFKYILVDEFQDTNWAQYQLIKLLSGKERNLTVCGDDKQAIYRFRGASFGNIVLFQKDFLDAKQIFLTQNYRSGQEILDLAFKSIQLNENKLENDQRLVSVVQEKGKVEHLHFKDLDQEINGIIGRIREILDKDDQASFSNFAILVRSNSGADKIGQFLERSGTPYQFLGSKGLYSKPIIIDLISYFKLLDNFHESSAMYRILSIPFLDIPIKDLAKITHFSRKKTQSIYETIQQLSLISGLDQKTIDQINFLLGLIKKHTKLSSQKSVSELFVLFIQESGLLKYLVEQKNIQDLNHIDQFFNKLKAFEESNTDLSLKSFMAQLDLELESGEQGRISFDIDQGPDVVKLMTIHGAKGLEFKYVFLANLVDRRFPVPDRKPPIEIPEKLIKDIVPQGNVHLEEERRLFYVAITRAKKQLFLCSAQDYGGTRKKKLSRFLTELGFSDEKILSEKKEMEAKTKKQESKVKLDLPNHFSFSQFKTFESCPYKYRFLYLLKIPTQGKAIFSYGSTIHNTLEKFLKLGKDSLSELIKIYEQEWIDDWYETKTEKQERFESGKKSLELFLKDLKESRPQILLINEKPALEQSFNLKIADTSIHGKIDRIDVLDDGVEIIDYKTGKAKEKLDASDKKQLLIYQLAAKEVLGLNPVRLTYHYIDKDQKIPFLASNIDLEKEKQNLIKLIEKIKKSDFKATPGWQCGFCDFKDICEFAKK